MVGADAVRSPRGQPEQGAFFGGVSPAFLHPQHVGKGTGAAHLEKHARVYLLTEFGHGLGIESCHACLRRFARHSALRLRRFAVLSIFNGPRSTARSIATLAHLVPGGNALAVIRKSTTHQP